MTKKTLSACMIVKNEQDFLPQCLHHIKDYVDEIVIVDTGSTDKSVEIAKEAGARVIEKKWDYDFSAARNESLKHATGDWILIIDADELITKEDMKKIRALINDETTKVDAYFLDQVNYTNTNTSIGWKPVDNYANLGGEATGYFISPLIRLFSNNKGFKFRYKIHETVIDSVRENGGVIGKVKIPIHHYGQVRGYDKLQQKLKMYNQIIEDQTSEFPDDAKVHYQMGVKQVTEGQIEEAVKTFHNVIELDASLDLPHIHLGDIYQKKDDVSSAIREYAKAIEKNPKKDLAYIKLAALFTQHKKFDDALRIIAIANKNKIKSPAIYSNLGFILMRLGKQEEAIKVFEEGVNLVGGSTDPYYEKMVNYIVDCYLELNRKDDAIKFLEETISKKPLIVEKLKKRLEEIK